MNALKIVDKHIGKYRDKVIILQMLVEDMLSCGVDFYKQMTDEVMNSLELSNLEIDIIQCKRELAKECSIVEICDLIVYINRHNNFVLNEMSGELKYIKKMLRLLVTNMKKQDMSMEDFYYLFDLDEEELEDIISE